jgi:hypothetical protein
VHLKVAYLNFDNAYRITGAGLAAITKTEANSNIYQYRVAWESTVQGSGSWGKTVVNWFRLSFQAADNSGLGHYEDF